MEQKKPNDILSTIGRRAKDSFIAADMDNIGEYLMQHVILPSAKDLTSNIIDSILGNITNVKDILIYGEDAHPHKRTKNSYASIYRSNGAVVLDNKNDASLKKTNRVMKRSNGYDFDNIYFDDLSQCQAIISALGDVLDEYDAVNVADFCEFAGITSSPNDYNWGWRDLSSVMPRRTSSGWVIKLPKPIYLRK